MKLNWRLSFYHRITVVKNAWKIPALCSGTFLLLLECYFCKIPLSKYISEVNNKNIQNTLTGTVLISLLSILTKYLSLAWNYFSNIWISFWLVLPIESFPKMQTWIVIGHCFGSFLVKFEYIVALPKIRLQQTKNTKGNTWIGLGPVEVFRNIFPLPIGLP